MKETSTIWCQREKPIYLRGDGKARSIESKLLREKRTYTLSVRGEKLDSDPLGPVRLIRIIKSIGIVERKKSSDRWEHIYWIIYKNRTFQGWSWCFVYNIQKCPSLFFKSSSRLFPNILFFFFLFPLYIFSLSQPRFRSKSLWFTILIRGWFSKCGQVQIALLTRHKVPRRLISNNIP